MPRKCHDTTLDDAKRRDAETSMTPGGGQYCTVMPSDARCLSGPIIRRSASGGSKHGCRHLATADSRGVGERAKALAGPAQAHHGVASVAERIRTGFASPSAWGVEFRAGTPLAEAGR